MNPTIKQSAELVQKDLADLLSGKILALRIYPFADKSVCQRWQKSLKQKGRLNRYSNATNVPVTRIGMTLFEIENNPEKITQYLEEGQLTISYIRKIFGEINPLEQMIEKFTTCWQAGCEIQEMSKTKMNPGIIRSFESTLNGGLPPHIDCILKDLSDNNEFRSIECQLAANLYFDISDKGGELELWNYAPNSLELNELFTGDYDFIDKEKIPVTSQKITPKEGELILFRSNCIHSVTECEGGTRSAASCFIGYYDEERPLTVWA